MLLKNAQIPDANGFVRCDIRLEEGRIVRMGELNPMPGEAVTDLAGDYLLPGFVDVHIHAVKGNDTMQSEEAIRRMSRDLYGLGVAAFLPTTMSATMEETRAAIAAVRAVMDRPEDRGARVLGAHMEAPFLNPQKAGAQKAECLMNPNWEMLLKMTGGDIPAVRMITLAPELPGAEALIRRCTQAGVTVSIGHTAATAEQTHQAADWGASHVTHTFNAQTALNHRAPGVPGAAMADDRLYTEFIADGVHLHEDIIRLMARCKGAARAVAITDAMEAAAMPDGQYALGGQAVTVKNGEARLKDGTLAGSVLTMAQALHNLIHRFGIAPIDAVRMCTATPADSIGETAFGRMQPGLAAPLSRWTKEWEYRGVID